MIVPRGTLRNANLQDLFELSFERKIKNLAECMICY